MRAAIDYGGTYARVWLSGEEGIERFDTPSWPLTRLLEYLKARYPSLRETAVAYAGQVYEGLILSAPNIDIDEPDIVRWAETSLSVKLRIENDLNCAALAESHYWNEPNLVALYSGTGLGAGIVERGAIFHGYRGMAGEIGHIPYQRAPFRCGCGKDNCLELHASGNGLRRWREHLGCGCDFRLDTMRRAGGSCREIADFFIMGMVYAAATLATLCNPRLIVLGGGIVAKNPWLADRVSELLPRYAMPAALEGLRLEISAIKEAPLEGAKLLLDTIKP